MTPEPKKASSVDKSSVQRPKKSVELEIETSIPNPAGLVKGIKKVNKELVVGKKKLVNGKQSHPKRGGRKE
jgi:hypothetical protein